MRREQRSNLAMQLARERLLGVRVLLVDDDCDTRALLGRILRLAGAEVVDAPGAEEAMACLDRDYFDVVVSDIGMPRIDGYEFIRRAKHQLRSRRWLPAIALTAFTRPEDKDAALAAGFDQHLAKPVDFVDLIDKVEELAVELACQRPGR